MTGTAPSVAADPCSAPANEIVAENCKPGTPSSVWDIPGAGSSSIQGYATDISVNQSQRVSLKIDTSAPSYRFDIYRMGYYGGSGARRVAEFGSTAGTRQPACRTEASTGLVECSNWSVTASWDVPADAVSGIYFAHLVDSGGGESHIFFVVRDDDGRSDLLFQTSDTTWQAYNQYGSHSLYTGGPGVSPQHGEYGFKVSYDRPFTTRDNAPEDWVFNAEYPMVRWLERNGYDVSYFSGVDSDRLGAELMSTARSSPLATTSIGRRPSARTSPRRATPASTSRSSAATRSSGRRGGRTTAGRWSPTRRLTPAAGSTRPARGRAHGVTLATARTTVAGPRTR